jgi:uncharacterized protein
MGPEVQRRPPGPALVTGASSGLGREFAVALAARGHGLLLVARRAGRLEELAARLRRDHGVRVAVLACDLATDDGRAALRAALETAPLEVAVFNAGFGSLGPFADSDREREDRMVRLNCEAVVDLARWVVPGMRQRGNGRVIITSSAAAFHPVPYMATYGATKAFELHFARALREELRGTGVGVLAVCPGPTATEFSEVLTGAGRGASGWPSAMPVDTPAAVVAAALAAADHDRGVVATGRVSRLTRIGTALVPTAWTLRAVGIVHRRRARTAKSAGKTDRI